MQPFFIDGAAGRLFLLLRAPEGAKEVVLIVPPFAEEMNKCRRQFSETTEALIKAGYAVLVLDLFGTGDSEGEFSEARWTIWRADVESALAWIDAAGYKAHAVLATRLGCVLAAESLQISGASVNKTVFWQPVAKGRQFMTQFLRLRVAASMMEGGAGETVDSLRQRLDEGELVPAAGYDISPDLQRSIDDVELSPTLDACLGRLHIVEVSTMASEALSPAGKGLLDAAQKADVPATGTRLQGEPFWTATEIVVNRELVDLTADFIAEASL